ncbi:hypothetical protein IW261DRAFT_641664 [Armillaria novae-zelandiae]|uniref:Uncharacterized protein n=1 Tax=Armillaria novae-zelandiae TaxID=153914 RepID=A0AA39UFZ5_9AGAR|nr:hypothetical protein IW261DRAFT_641664 [Armillaria novae-zelandiae]
MFAIILRFPSFTFHLPEFEDGRERACLLNFGGSFFIRTSSNCQHFRQRLRYTQRSQAWTLIVHISGLLQSSCVIKYSQNISSSSQSFYYLSSTRKTSPRRPICCLDLTMAIHNKPPDRPRALFVQLRPRSLIKGAHRSLIPSSLLPSPSHSQRHAILHAN